MSEKQETIADIIAEKRLRAAEMEKTLGDQHSFVESLKDDADRIEAAWNREKSVIEADALAVGGIVGATAEKPSVVGDCAKMREALKTVKRYLDGYTVNVLEMRRQVDAALASPPRNCDVGTADEQTIRFIKFCRNFPKCTGCPCVGQTQYIHCEFAWAQLPYEAKEGGNNVV